MLQTVIQNIIRFVVLVLVQVLVLNHVQFLGFVKCARRAGSRWCCRSGWAWR